MKNIVLLLPLLLQVVAAAGVAVGPLPAPELPDTEVSNNFFFSVGEALHLLSFLHYAYTANPPVPLFRIESKSTNETYSYAMPSNGVRHEYWWRRGAYEDVFRHDFGGVCGPRETICLRMSSAMRLCSVCCSMRTMLKKSRLK